MIKMKVFTWDHFEAGLPDGSAWDGGSVCLAESTGSSSPYPVEAAYSGGTSRHHLVQAGINIYIN